MYKVLIVDDSWEQRKDVFESFLSVEKYITEYIKNPNEFRKKDIESYDLVFLDVNLELWDMTFSEACSVIVDKAPVIVVSMKWEEEITVVRMKEALSHSPEINVIQSFDLRWLNQPNEDEDKQVAGVFKLLTEVALSCHRKETVFPVDDGKEIHILHISDTQYEDPGTDDWSKYVEEDLGDFLKLKFPYIHFIAITGDLAYSGKEHEYDKAIEGIEKLMKGLWNRVDSSTRERLIIVPGNHDIDYRVSSIQNLTTKFGRDSVDVEYKADTTNEDFGGEYRHGSTAYRRFAYKLTGNKKWIQSSNLCWRDKRFHNIGLDFIYFNTAHYIDCENPKKAKIPEEATSRLLKDRPSNSAGLLSIVLSHHGPAAESNSEGLETVEDWPRVSNFLRVGGAKLWIHGHGHEKIVEKLDYQYCQNSGDNKKIQYVEKNDFIRIMAPTTHLDGNLRPDGENKGFNILRLNRTNGIVESIDVLSYVLEKDGPKKQEESCITFNFPQ